MTGTIDNKTILSEELDRLREDIINSQKEHNAWASGKTAEGYAVNVESPFHAALEGYAYVGAMDKGRKAGKVPYNFNEIIKRWIEAKGLKPKGNESLERMANSIAWCIKKKGSYLHRNGYELHLFDEPVKNFSERLADRLSSLYQQETINQIFK
jgi:hypothetical protein